MVCLLGKRRTAQQDPTRVEVGGPRRRPTSDVFTVNASDGMATVQNAPGQAFGRYTLLRRLASGGMGEIFLAKQGGQGGFSKVVAIKRILAHYKEDDDHVRMFFDEAKLQALLSDRHIVQIYDMGEIDDHLFIAMEYVHGVSWRKLLERVASEKRQVHPAHAVDLAVQVARGLSYAHNVKGSHGEPLNVVHRDVSPQNAIISWDGEVKVIDFGIAKSDINDVHTTTGTLKGKFAYMSPEQGSGEKLDRRSDIFSFGICLWELLGQKNPFKRGNVVASLAAIQNEPHTKIGSLRRDCRAFDRIIDKALAKDADKRYDDCSEIAEDLVELYASGRLEEPPQPLATWLQTLFADEIEDHLALLDRVGAGQGLSRRGDSERSKPIGASPYGMDAETSDPRRRKAARLHDAPTAVLADAPDTATAEPSLFDGVATAPGPPPSLATFGSETNMGPPPSLVDANSTDSPVSLDSSEYVALQTDSGVGELMGELPVVDIAPPMKKGDTDPTVSAPTSVEALSGEVPAPPARGRSLLKGTLFGLGLGMVCVVGLLVLAAPPDDGGDAPANPVVSDEAPDDTGGGAVPDDDTGDDAVAADNGNATKVANASGRRVDRPARRTEVPTDERASRSDKDDSSDPHDKGAAAKPATDPPDEGGDRDATSSTPDQDAPTAADDATSDTPTTSDKPAPADKPAAATTRTDDKPPARTRKPPKRDKPAKTARKRDDRAKPAADDDDTPPAKEPTRADPPPSEPEPPKKVAVRKPSAKLDARAPSGYRLSGGSARRSFGVGSKGVTVKVSGPEGGHSFALRLTPTEGGALVTPMRECRTILRFNGGGIPCKGTFKLPYNKRSVLRVASPGKESIEIVLKLSEP
jgi:serine/threonine protein kinase